MQMKCSTVLALVIVFFIHAGMATAQTRPRVFVLTDLSNEPDDEESLVRFLVYANEYDVDGLVATTSTWLKDRTREDLLRRQLDAYAQVHSNLTKHAPGFPSADQLRAVTRSGQPTYGMASVGQGKSTEGSKLLIEAIEKADERPMWISIWGGANTLAQSLIDMRASRSADDMNKAIAKMRVYTISDQDDAGSWIRKEFPQLFYVVTPSNADGKDYHRATWTGISGDRHYKNGPMHKFDLVDNPWLEANIIFNHGSLGALYPKLKYIMEGDTPAFLFLVDNGLGSAISPGYGGWGGRYVLYKPLGEPRAIWTNNADSRDTVTADNGKTETTDPASVWRWREHFQHDFAARMDWCITDDFKKANHNPVAVLNDDKTKNVITIPAKSRGTVPLSAVGTSDPDGNTVNVTWWIYPEAGTLRGNATLSAAQGLTTELRIPETTRAGKLHVILQASDNGTPSLFSYRRVIVDVTP